MCPRAIDAKAPIQVFVSISCDSSRVTRGTWPDDGPATDLRHGANARR
jgi:hypothetical protein